MLDRISETFKIYAKGWLILTLFAGAMVFNLFILPKPLARLQQASGGRGPIDLQFFYTPQKAYSLIASYGNEVRAFYRTFELTGDTIYPIIYASFFALLLSWLFQRGFAKDSRMQKLNIIPLGAWLFDLLEDIGIVSMLSIYPSTPAALAWITALFTLFKWLFFAATIGLILIGFGMVLSNKPKEQKALI